MERKIQDKDILCRLEATMFFKTESQNTAKGQQTLSDLFCSYVNQFVPGHKNYLEPENFESYGILSGDAIKLVFYRTKGKDETFKTMGNGTQWQSDAVELVISFAEYVNEILVGINISCIVFREGSRQFKWEPNS